VREPAAANPVRPAIPVIPARTLRMPPPVPPGQHTPGGPAPADPGPALPPALDRPVLRRAALLALGVLLAVAAIAWLGGHDHSPRGGRPRPSAPVRSAVAHRPSPARSGPASATAGHSPAPGPSGSAHPTRHGIVSISPVLAHRAVAQQIAALLDSYFDAVNRHRYGGYSRLFEPQHRLTAGQFRTGYQSTHDSDAVLAGLIARAHGLTATVTFQSHQTPAASPNHARCTDWRITLYLRRAGGAYLIGPPPAGYRASYHACGSGPAAQPPIPS